MFRFTSPIIPPPGYTEYYEKDTGFIVYEVLIQSHQTFFFVK